MNGHVLRCTLAQSALTRECETLRHLGKGEPAIYFYSYRYLIPVMLILKYQHILVLVFTSIFHMFSWKLHSYLYRKLISP